ncbi:MAG: XkdX family protein [Synergistaceae bacterium]|nr:XkdX family protein [Synergistaceae bacterium]MBQ3695269.1 XkdX family protein [Synergistaceae bacterium]MBQ6111316.1 XkdX family protein [Synergistaceae bacterium]MBR0251180.1 XkdX family protein [Synergistaceae bacterium]
MFRKIKEYFNLGLWDELKVHKAVEKGKITPEEFRAITGKDYE